MKKTLSILLCAVLTLCLLCGCGDSGEGSLFDQIKAASGESNGGFAASGNNSSGPEKVVKQYVDAVNDNNLKALLNCLTPEAGEILEEELEYVREEAPDMTLSELMSDGAHTKLTIHNTLMLGDSYAIVDTTISYADYEDRNPVTCCKIDGKWYLDLNNDYDYLAEEGNTGASSPEKVVDALVNAINKNDIQGLIDIYNPEDRLEIAEDLYYDAIVEGYTLSEGLYGEAGLKTKVKVEDVWKDGDEAEVYCTISVSNGMEESGEVECIRVNGKWYLLDM